MWCRALIRFHYLAAALPLVFGIGLGIRLGVVSPQEKPGATRIARDSSPPLPAPALSAGVSPLPKPGPGYHAPLGQTLVYGAAWRLFNAGIVTLRIEPAGQEDRVLGSADAIGTVAVLYHVHDRFESFFSPSDFCSHNISKNIEEGFRKVDTTISFDYQRGKAVLDQKNYKKNDSKHTENEIPACVTDVLSALYYAGSFPLQPGQTYSFPLNDGGKTVPVDLHVEAREPIKTPAGAFNTIRVRPEAPAELLKNKGQLWIWYSDDEARLPVQLRARFFWGTITFVLQRIDRQ